MHINAIHKKKLNLIKQQNLNIKKLFNFKDNNINKESMDINKKSNISNFKEIHTKTL